jgi:hypothetical protein
MNTKYFLCVLAAAAFAMSDTAIAYDGAINDATLSAMGLGGATIVSDDDAMQVRGTGFAIAAGGSFAFVGSHRAAAGSANGYLAAGRHFAGGVNKSYAGKTVTKIEISGRPQRPGPVVRNGNPQPRPTRTVTIKSVRVYAGGYSAAASF